MKIPRDEAAINLRLELLHEFLDAAKQWLAGNCDEEVRGKLKSLINRKLIAARRVVLDAGTLPRMTIGPPPAVGGVIPENIDPFQNFFRDFWGASLVPTVIDSVEQAIGVYEFMLSNPSLLRSIEAIDGEAAIERALRPQFRDAPPEREKVVQDAVENVLNSLA